MTASKIQIIENILNMQNGDGHTFVSISTKKEQPLVKKNRKSRESTEGQVLIQSTDYKSMGLGANYEKSVNGRRTKEGKEADFEAQSLPWGEWRKDSKNIIDHKNKSYIRVYSYKSSSTNKSFTINGKSATYDQAMEIIKSKPSNKSNDHQGLDNPVVPMNIDISTIESITINGEKFEF